MVDIFVGQSALRFQLTCGCEIFGTTSASIQFTRPNGTAGEWSASILNGTKGIIYHDVQSSSEIDVSGEWTLWSKVTFADGRIGYGQPVKQKVYTVGLNRY